MKYKNFKAIRNGKDVIIKLAIKEKIKKVKFYPKQLLYFIVIPLYILGTPFFVLIEEFKGVVFYYFKTLENIKDYINKK